MPRQPYLRVVPNPKNNRYDIGTHVLAQRPELETLIAHCVMSWPHIEAEMSILLGQLLGSDNAAALAVFQELRRSSAQRDAIGAAAKAALDKADQELVYAVLNVHKGIEAERNAIVHGHFGTATSLPEALIWQTTADFIALRADQTFTDAPTWDDAKQKILLESLWVYRKADFEALLADLKRLASLWFHLTRYLRTKDQKARAEEYDRLCGQPRVAQELATLRQKNSS